MNATMLAALLSNALQVRPATCDASEVTFVADPEADERVGINHHLAVLGEEPLCTAETAPTLPERYRFIWLRSFDPWYVVRLDVPSGMPASITWTRSDKPIGVEPTRVVRSRTRPYARPSPKGQSQQDIDRQIAEIGSLADILVPHVWNVVDPSVVVVDGSSWIVEVVRDGRCDLAERMTPPSDDPVRAFGWLLMEIAGRSFSYDEVY